MRMTRTAMAVLVAWLSAAAWVSAATFEEGWKWYKHRQAQRAPEEELLDILKTLKQKYEGAANMSEVDQEIRRYTKTFSVPRRGVSAQAGYDDGWKWYLHRRAEGAPDTELVEVLRRLQAKYTDLGVDVSQATAELARYDLPDRPPAAKNAPAAPPLPTAPMAPLPAPQERPTLRKPPPASMESPADRDARLRRRIEELKDPDPKVRLTAVRELKEARDPRAVGPLVPLLSDPDNFVSIVAANALVQMGEPALEPLLQAARSEKPNVRLVACVALGDLGHPAAIPVLEERAGDKAGEVREASRNALNKIRSKSSQKRWAPSR